MLDANSISIDKIVSIFSGSEAQERIAFIEECPITNMKEQALIAAKMSLPEMHLQSLDFLASGCTTTGPYDLGAKMGAVCYRLARDRYEKELGQSMTYQLIAGRGALNWMTCLQQLGCHTEIVDLIGEPIEWLESIGDEDNLDMLKLKLVESEIDLENYDNAENHLGNIDESLLPAMVRVSYRAIKYRVEQHKGGGTSLPEEQTVPTKQDLLKTLEPISSKLSYEEKTNDSIPYDLYKDTAKDLVNRLFGGASGAVNEFTVRQKIIDSTWIFRDEVKGNDPKLIGKAEKTLIVARDWMKENNLPDSENEACWGLYLCYSRTKREDLAAIELQKIRANIEKARSKIDDPVERARLSERYPYLHAAECTMLYKLGRNKDLLEAIEAAKSRALADMQTIRDGRPADERQFSIAIRNLPSYMKELGCHYLTIFVDDDAVFCSLITSDGQFHSSRVDLSKASIKKLAKLREPRLWGRKDPRNPFGPRNPEDLPQQLSPIVEWLTPLYKSGLMKEGDHLCYSPHGALLAVPFHYINLGGYPMVEYFSMSRAHGAHSLLETLRTESHLPESCLVVDVPSKQDLNDKIKIEAFTHVSKWFQENISKIEELSRENGDILHLSLRSLRNRIIHFATHGRFPEEGSRNIDPNPFRSSGLVVAAKGQLPDLMMIAQNQGSEHLLTPEKTIRLGLDFTGTHLTLQACVSGLSKMGYGGDALGLEWAFLQLGVKSILSTHWQTSAQTTSLFSERFYDRWLQHGESKAAAWRNTVLELRKKSVTSDPYHWAAFSLTGDWR